MTNYVGFLQEFFAKKHLDPPIYDYERTGQDHAPTFTGIVKVVDPQFPKDTQTFRGDPSPQKKVFNFIIIIFLL